MDNRKIFNAIVCLFLGSTLYAQDSTSIKKQNALVDRFETITGKEINWKDTVQVLKNDLVVSSSTIKQQNVTIDGLKSEITQLEKYYLIGKYGHPGIYTPYGKQQFDDFQKNGFLKSYNNAYSGTHVYFAFEEKSLDLSLYTAEFTKLVNESKNTGKKIYIEGYSDSWGKAETNLAYSKQRATVVKEYLMKNFNVPASDIVVNAYGINGPNRYREQDMDFLNRQVIISIK